MPYAKHDTVFLEYNLPADADWGGVFADAQVKRLGTGTVAGTIDGLEEIGREKPARLFLLAGFPDAGSQEDGAVGSIVDLVSRIHGSSPDTAVFLPGLLPICSAAGLPLFPADAAGRILQANRELGQRAASGGYTFIDVHTSLCDDSGRLKPEYGRDGHLSRKGRMMWRHLIFPFVFQLQDLPSLVPFPRLIRWTDARFPLYDGVDLQVEDAFAGNAGKALASMLGKAGIRIHNKNSGSPVNGPVIVLSCEAVEASLHPEEAYRIDVTAGKAVLTAHTPHGAFNAVQTLRQLLRDRTFIPGCHIRDWPAFSWRGLMVDVARNYQSVKQLKQQVDIMSQYKMNVLHLHLTDDIAWRLEVGGYPALTGPAHMLRDKGLYYSAEDMKKLTRYCSRRFITVVPEIDMPGHSGAFSRIFGTGMQSRQGTEITRNLLRAISATYDVPFIHLGTDEVTVTNRTFIPEMVSLLQQLGKKAIGWHPGAEAQGIIRQEWGNAPAAADAADSGLIDSRGLYLNHMDPLAGIVSIFEKRLCETGQGSDRMLGGEICLWNDRRAAVEKDILRMNPVYPAVVTFAERSWRGGGQAAMTMAMGRPGSEDHAAFAEFERRLLDQKRQYFTTLPFPYVRQSPLQWKLFGPFDNQGDLEQSFWPETADVFLQECRPDKVVTGGTIILRHWWHPDIRGWIDDPRENTTLYAWRRFHRDAGGTGFLWAGFNDPSRSTATDAPKPGTWDRLQSRIWLNGQIIRPPDWKHGSMAGNSEIPLTDEGYSYRPPVQVIFKKGWNEILIKAPVGAFESSDWQNPVKWMFTAVCVRRQSGCNWFEDE